MSEEGIKLGAHEHGSGRLRDRRGRRDGFRKTVASGQGFFDVFIVYSYRTKPPYARAKPSSR